MMIYRHYAIATAMVLSFSFPAFAQQSKPVKTIKKSAQIKTTSERIFINVRLNVAPKKAHRIAIAERVFTQHMTKHKYNTPKALQMVSPTDLAKVLASLEVRGANKPKQHKKQKVRRITKKTTLVKLHPKAPLLLAAKLIYAAKQDTQKVPTFNKRFYRKIPQASLTILTSKRQRKP